jgi:hypothetical protein
MRSIGRRFAVLVGTAAVAMAFASSALATTHYINNQSGSGCTNAGSGTSTGSPWCDFTNVNTTTFGAGDQILLARGATWSSAMTLAGSGNSSSPITVDAYGSGARPKIVLSDGLNDTGITLTNGDYWSFNNLDISHATLGIGVKYTSLGHNGLSFNNIYVHDNAGDLFGQGSTSPTNWPNLHYSTGIYVTEVGVSDPGTGASVIDGITMSNIEAFNTDDPVDLSCGFVSNAWSPNCVKDVLIKNSYFHYSGACPLFQNITNLTFLDSTITQGGNTFQSVGTTGYFLWEAENTYFANDVFENTQFTSGSPDQTGMDLEAYVDKTYFRGNYFANNSGAGLEILQIFSRPGDHSTVNDLWDNTFYNNTLDGSTGRPFGGVYLDGSNTTPTGTLRDNLYYEPFGFNTGSSWSGFTVTGNVGASSMLNLYNEAGGFSGVQGANGWSYEANASGTYSPLSFDSTNNWWGTSSAYVNRFDLLPDANASDWVTKTWTAPQSGTIEIRGRVLKNQTGGDGVRARITKNGAVIWPSGGSYQSIAASDQSGYDAEAFAISVSAGDHIRFEVNDGGGSSNTSDLTSWVPSLTYTSTSGTVTTTDDSTTGTGMGQWSYSGGSWSSCTGCTGPSPARYNNSVTWSDTTNDYALFKFTGRQVALYGELRDHHGIGAASICDSSGNNCGSEVLFDLYSGNDNGNQLVYRSPTLTSGTYTLKVRVTGTRNVASTDNVVVIDRADVTS